MYGTPPGIPGLVQTNITNSSEEKWALLDKDIEMEDSKTENENGNGRTILYHIISFHYNVDVIIQISTTDARSSICAERSTFLVYYILLYIVRANFVLITRREGRA